MYNSLLIFDLEKLNKLRDEIKLDKNTNESIKNKLKEIFILYKNIRYKALSLSKNYLNDEDILRLNKSIKLYDDSTHNNIIYPNNKLYKDEYIK